MIGYKYDTKEKAMLARKKCADYYGLPKTPTSTTIYKVNYLKASLDTPIFWYIPFDESIRVVLGESETFNVTEEET